MIEFLVDNIYVRFGGQLLQQTVDIPMEQTVPHYWLTCFSILDILIKEGKRKLARKISLSYRYIDDLISFNNKRFKEFIPDIYPKELTVYETTEYTSFASYLDVLFTRDKNSNITTKLYDKRDTFGFHIVNFPLLCQAVFHQHQPMVSMHLSSLCPLLLKL